MAYGYNTSFDVFFSLNYMIVQNFQFYFNLNFECSENVYAEGNKRYSMRMDRTWRLEMEIEWTNDDCSIGIIGLYDLTKHYGD